MRTNISREAELQSLYDSVSFFMGITEIENEHVILISANRATAEFTDRKPEEMTGFAHLNLGITSEFEELSINHYRRCQQSGKPVRFEYQDETRAGDWFEATVAFIGLQPNGNPRFSFVIEDITERKRREANAAFLAEVVDAYSRVSTAEEIMRVVGTRAGEVLGLTTLSFVDVDVEHNSAFLQYVWNKEGTRSLNSQILDLKSYVSEVFVDVSSAGKTWVVNDTQSDSRTYPEACATASVGAAISVPFLQGGIWTSYIAVTDSKPRVWRPDEIEVIESLANRVFPGIERARAEALRDVNLQLTEADRRKNEFLAVLSHELRNPLTPITNGLYILDHTEPGGEQAIVARQFIGRQVTQLTKLVVVSSM